LQQRLTSLASDHQIKHTELPQLQQTAPAQPAHAVDLLQHLPRPPSTSPKCPTTYSGSSATPSPSASPTTNTPTKPTSTSTSPPTPSPGSNNWLYRRPPKQPTHTDSSVTSPAGGAAPQLRGSLPDRSKIDPTFTPRFRSARAGPAQ